MSFLRPLILIEYDAHFEACFLVELMDFDEFFVWIDLLMIVRLLGQTRGFWCFLCFLFDFFDLNEVFASIL